MNARISARYNAVVRNHLEELCTFAELRNCIVHFRDDHMEIVAEPSDAITENVERIAQLLCKDQKVLCFTTSPVIVCQIDEAINDVAIRMDQHQTDRIPVYTRKKFMGVLTLQQALHYVLNHSTSEIQVSDILEETKKQKVLFVDRNCEIQSVVELFEDFASINQRSPIILVTETGNHDEPLLGIISLSDLAMIATYLA